MAFFLYVWKDFPSISGDKLKKKNLKHFEKILEKV